MRQHRGRQHRERACADKNWHAGIAPGFICPVRGCCGQLGQGCCAAIPLRADGIGMACTPTGIVAARATMKAITMRMTRVSMMKRYCRLALKSSTLRTKGASGVTRRAACPVAAAGHNRFVAPECSLPSHN